MPKPALKHCAQDMMILRDFLGIKWGSFVREWMRCATDMYYCLLLEERITDSKIRCDLKGTAVNGNVEFVCFCFDRC
jgi:hypothetical protein